MSRAYRILVVEDWPDSAELYAGRLRAEQYEVDVACNVADAIRMLNEKSYDVALVDMNLTGIPQDRSGGEKVLRTAGALDDAIEIVVLTAEEDAQFAADLVQDWGVSRYVAKSLIIDHGFQVVLNNIRVALPALDQITSSRQNLIDLLAGAESEPVWVDSALRILTPKDGYLGLLRFLQEFLRDLTPLISMRRTDGPALRADETGRALEGNFWSKRIGCPVLLRVEAAKSAHATVPSGLPNGMTVVDVVCEHIGSGLIGKAWAVRGASRSLFK